MTEVPQSSPRISVVVIEWKPRGWLKGAVESILDQDYPAQVVVAKNAREPAVDTWLVSKGVSVILCTDTEIGPKYAAGLAAATGEVVCLLEDDDRFLPGKLKRLALEFTSHRDLSMVHHGHRRLNIETSEHTVGPHIPDFNCSSMALRRRDLEDVMPRLVAHARKHASGVPEIPDTQLYYTFMALGKTMVQLPDPLTEIRYDPGAPSPIGLSRGYLELAKEIDELGGTGDRKEALTCLLGLYFSALMRTRGVEDPTGAAWADFKLLSTHRFGPLMPNMREVLCGSLHPFSPTLSRAVYSRFRRGSIDWINLRGSSP